eukprot:s295_g4.t1
MKLDIINVQIGNGPAQFDLKVTLRKPGVETQERIPQKPQVPTSPISADLVALPKALPTNWVNQDISAGHFRKRCDVSGDGRDMFQILLDQTFKAKSTRDRQGQLPRRLRDSALWSTYMMGLEGLRSKFPQGCTSIRHHYTAGAASPEAHGGSVATSEVLSSLPVLDGKINEFYLLHGTSPGGALGITDGGFRLDFSGSHAGSMFGPPLLKSSKWGVDRLLCLEETAMLHSPMDLHLVLLPFVDVSQAQINDLTAAASRGQMAGVESMLLRPQDPDLLDSNGCAALMAAAGQRYVKIVHMLLEADANLDLAGIDGRTALMRASDAGHLDIVRSLLEAGANKDIKDVADSDGRTALHRAAIAGDVEIVRLLLRAGANKDLADVDGRTALICASEACHLGIVHWLLEARANLDMAGIDGRTALMRASDAGLTNIVRLLLESGANKDVVDNDGRTALHRASIVGHLDIVHLLLEAGADKDVADNDGRTALHRASNTGRSRREDHIAILLHCELYS